MWPVAFKHKGQLLYTAICGLYFWLCYRLFACGSPGSRRSLREVFFGHGVTQHFHLAGLIRPLLFHACRLPVCDNLPLLRLKKSGFSTFFYNKKLYR